MPVTSSEFSQQVGRLYAVADSMTKLAELVRQGARLVTQGTDDTGRVTVVVDRAGLAETIRVRPDWRVRIEPARLPSAIADAYRQVLGAKLAGFSLEWTRSAAPWVAPVRPATAEIGPTNRAEVVATAMPPDPLSRSFERLSAAAWDRVESIQQRAAGGTEQPAGTGISAAGNVVVTIRIDVDLRCRIEVRWAEQQTAAGLMNALNPALRDARKNLAEYSETDRFPLQPHDADPLLGELLALLNNPEQFADEVGGRL